MSKSVVVLLLIIVTMLTTSTFALERKKKGGHFVSTEGECKNRKGWKDCVAGPNAKGNPCYWCDDGNGYCTSHTGFRLIGRTTRKCKGTVKSVSDLPKKVQSRAHTSLEPQASFHSSLSDLEDSDDDLDESKSESKSQSVTIDSAEEVKQWLKRNKIKYDPDKFIKAGIDELESLELLEDKDTVKEVYPDMTTVDILKILKAIKKMTLTPKPQSRFRSSQAALSPVEA
mgnify:CR=1 FL=1